MQVKKIQGRHFLRKKNPAGRSTTSPRAWFHYLPLSAVICRYLFRDLPLFAISLSTICRYLPLAIPLFATKSNILALFPNYVYRKLPIRVI